MRFSHCIFSIVFLHFAGGSDDYDHFNFDEFVPTPASTKQGWNETTMDKLKKVLFMNYDKYAGPHHQNTTSKLSIGLSILHLETDELKSTCTIHTWVRMVWLDEKMVWDEEDYEGLSVLRIADHELWQPDIYLYNSASGGEPIIRFGNPNVLVYPNGEVLMVPPVKLTVLCQYNLRYWPFDTQFCQIMLGSWTYNGNEINLTLYNNQKEADLSDLETGISWNIVNTTAAIITKYYNCCTEPYHHQLYNLTLVRNPETYEAVVVTPAVVVSLLILILLWLPPNGKEKLILTSFIVVISSCYLIYFTTYIATTGSDTPLIVIFYACNLYMVCFAILCDIISFWIQKSERLPFFSGTLSGYLNGRLSKCMILDLQLQSFDSKSSSFSRRESNQNLSEEWLVALLFNRILFVIYTVHYITVGVIYLF